MALNPGAIDARLASEPEALSRIRTQSKSDPKGAAKAAAQQFEALFLGMLMKSMRDTTSQATPFDNSQTRLMQSMLDQQVAQALAKRGVGLAAVIERQLVQQVLAQDPGALPEGAKGEFSLHPPAREFPLPAAPASAPAATGEGAPAAPAASPQVREFVNRLWPHALAASHETGIPAHFILGQAALESGWGRAEIRNADGSPSHNLFGIKAGRGWNGAIAQSATTEFVNGVPVKSTESFRSYASYGAAFLDYARLLTSDARYAPVLAGGQDAAGFARGLQRAGYATDPMYAEKLYRIITGGALRAGLMA